MSDFDELYFEGYDFTPDNVVIGNGILPAIHDGDSATADSFGDDIRNPTVNDLFELNDDNKYLFDIDYKNKLIATQEIRIDTKFIIKCSYLCTLENNFDWYTLRHMSPMTVDIVAPNRTQWYFSFIRQYVIMANTLSKYNSETYHINAVIEPCENGRCHLRVVDTIRKNSYISAYRNDFIGEWPIYDSDQIIDVSSVLSGCSVVQTKKVLTNNIIMNNLYVENCRLMCKIDIDRFYMKIDDINFRKPYHIFLNNKSFTSEVNGAIQIYLGTPIMYAYEPPLNKPYLVHAYISDDMYVQCRGARKNTPIYALKNPTEYVYPLSEYYTPTFYKLSIYLNEIIASLGRYDCYDKYIYKKYKGVKQSDEEWETLSKLISDNWVNKDVSI